MFTWNHNKAALALVCGTLFSTAAAAVTVDLDVTNPSSYSPGGILNYSSGGINLSISGFSNDWRGDIAADSVRNWGVGLGVENAWGPEHAIDNSYNYYSRSYDYDMVLLTFDQAVSLNSISAGWRGTNQGYYASGQNSEASILAYTGAGTAPSFVGSEWTDLLNDEWEGIGNYRIDNLNSPESVNAMGTVSRYWLVGAYNPTFNLMSGEQVSFSNGNDFWKLSGVSVSVNPVPLPGSLVLFGSALMLFGSLRRKKAKA